MVKRKTSGTDLKKIKGDGNVNKKILFLAVILLWGMGCAALESKTMREEKYGKAAPVIRDFFASQTMRYGDSWKVYLKAYDPDGDMKRIIIYLEKGGGGSTYSPTYTRIAEENRKEISGYLYWYPGPNLRTFSEIVTVVQIEDLAGHLSNTVSLPLSIQPSGRQELPPEGIFLEKGLGPIMITIPPVGWDGQ